MDKTLEALGGLLVRAIPTLLLVILLYFYLKRVFFRPLAKVLDERDEATEGARRAAEDCLARASEKTAECEAAMRHARTEIYREQEETRQRLRRQHEEAVRNARQAAQAMVAEEKRKLEAELAAAKQVLERRTEALADQIVATILGRRAA